MISIRDLIESSSGDEEDILTYLKSTSNHAIPGLTLNNTSDEWNTSDEEAIQSNLMKSQNHEKHQKLPKGDATDCSTFETDRLEKSTGISEVETLKSTPSKTGNVIWDNHSILQLLEEYDQRKTKASTKQFWKIITEQLQKKGYMYEKEQIRNKFNKLLMKYKSTRDHNNKTGNDPQSCPYYEEFEKIFSKNHNFNPVYACSSMNPLGSINDTGDEVDSMINKENTAIACTGELKRKRPRKEEEICKTGANHRFKNELKKEEVKKIKPKNDLLDYMKERDEKYFQEFNSQGTRMVNALDTLTNVLTRIYKS